MPATRSFEVPAWVTDGWFPNNPFGQRMAILRWDMPKSTPAEREAAQRFVLPRTSVGCSECGRFAFARPKVCFWCRSTT